MDINIVLKSVTKLPPTPQILPKLQKLLRDPNSSMSDIASLIKLDAPLAAQIIRVSNSAYYGASEPCHHIEDAVNRIGFNDVHKLVGAVSMRNVFGDGLPLYKLKSNDLWETSIRVGTVMQSLSGYTDADGDICYTIGLMHGLGMVIINNYHFEYGIPKYREGKEALKLTPKVERQLLGFENGQVASALLVKWNFPEEIYLPIQYQFHAKVCPNETRKLACLLSLSKQAIAQLKEEPEKLYDTFKPDEHEMEFATMTPELLIDAALDSESTFEWLNSSL